MAPREPIDFFAEAKVASLHKLDLLAKYLTPLTYKWGSGWRQIWLIDGFAGAGAYGDGRGQDGSPLIAAKWAAELARKRGFELLRCINVERDDACYASLRRHLAPWKHIATNLHGEFNDHLDAILERIGNDPAFFFLDPFGVNGVEMHFSDRAFKRMAGHSEEDDGRSPLAVKLGESKLGRLDAVMGTRLWRPRWEGEVADTRAAMEATAELYLSQLRERGIKHVHQIRMRDTLNDVPPYRLMFATGSPHGVVLMSDIACGYERALWDAEWGGTFDYELRHQELTAGSGELRDRIHALGLQLRVATPQELTHEIVPTLFGEYRTSDYNKAIRQLVSHGGIDRATPTGIKDNEQLKFVDLPQASLGIS
jgi:hypothetical protein